MSRLNQIVLYFPWLSYSSPRHSLFDTTVHNRLLLVLSSCCVFILFVTFSLQYYFYFPCHDCLILLLIKISFSSSLCLVDITLPILFVIIFSSYGSPSPCPNYVSSCYHDRWLTSTCQLTSLWAASCCILPSSISLCLSLLQFNFHFPDCLFPVHIIFSLSLFLCFSLSLSLERFSSSLNLIVIFF